MTATLTIRNAHGLTLVRHLADLCVLDPDTHAFTPLNHLRRQLEYCEDGSSVRYTIVHGQVVLENGRVSAIDEVAIRAQARAPMAGYQTQMAPAREQAAALEPAYRAMLERARAKPVGINRRLSPLGGASASIGAMGASAP